MKAVTIHALIAAMALIFGTPAFALGKVSRACAFYDIPEVLKTPALIFFNYLGMPDDLLNLASRPADDQKNHWILESLTTDYGSVRYYLFAENKIYKAYQFVGGAQQLRLEDGYKSPWASQSLDPQIFVDSRLSVFNFNRKVLTSVRAGHPDIVKYYPKSMFNSPWRNSVFRVVGRHYYFDAVSKMQGLVGDGKTDIAIDCNLYQWGLEDR